MSKDDRKLKIAILGTRGIPARYGGFETFAEELSTRLVSRGHQVTVYGRHYWGQVGRKGELYRGVTLRDSVTVGHKYLETPLASLSSFIDLWRRDFDAAILCNAANSPFAWLVRLRGVPLLINVDGIERRRSKWNRLGRAWYRLGELSSVLWASRVIADAEVIADYYREHYKCTPAVITYGATPQLRPPGPTLAQFGLTAGNYLLYVSRLEPENNAALVAMAYRAVATEMPLVIVGDAPYASKYKESIRAAADERVIFTGFQFGEAYQELRSNCYLYIQASEVGGTHPALVEAMAYGNCVVANDVPEHREVVQDCGVYYEKNSVSDLSKQLNMLVANNDLARSLGARAAARAAAVYQWDRIVGEYEREMLGALKVP